jgi:AraC family ethanolamine operon transcriptional activator
MSDSLFHPPAQSPRWITGGQFDDVDAQAAQLLGYGQEYQQLGRGRFRGTFASYFLNPEVGLHFERANVAIAYTGRSPADQYSLCVLSDDSPEATINGAVFSPRDVLVWPPGHEFDGISPAGLGFCVVALGQHAESLPLRPAQAGRPLRDPTTARRIWSVLCEGIEQFRSHPHALEHAAAVHSFVGALAERLAPLLPAANESGLDGMRGLTHRLHQFRRARDAMHEGLGQGINISSLCTSLGVSRRSLERMFLATLGMSPAQYIRMLQFNRIRKDLLSPQRRNDSIGTIAARWGVWHWSRFSRDYLRTFGELPSTTRLAQNG